MCMSVYENRDPGQGTLCNALDVFYPVLTLFRRGL